MRRFFKIVTLVVLALAVPVQMLAQEGRAAKEKEVRAAIEELTQANLKGGAEAASIFEKYYGDDYVRILSNGVVRTKADTLDSFRSGSVKFESFSLSDVKIGLYGNTAVVTGVATKIETFFGAAHNDPVRWTRVLVKRRGKWQCVLYQSTRIAADANPAKAQEKAKAAIVGTWRVTSFSSQTLETNEVYRRYENPIGYIQYSPGGHVVVFLQTGNPKKPATFPFSDSERAEMHKTIFGAYAGTYSVDGNKVTHHVVASWWPHWIGNDQVRYIEINDSKLTIKTAPQTSGSSGKQIVSVLTFERVE